MLCAVGATASWSAQAGPPRSIAEARRLFGEAEKSERAGKWAEALAKLEQVAALKETAGVRFHIATCHAHLGRLLEALDGFERARALARAQKADDVLSMVATQVEQLRRRVPVIRVAIPASVHGASVTVDRKPVEGDALSEILVDPGTHQVVITVNGESRLDRYVKLAEGESETVELRPPPAPGPAHVAAPKPSQASQSPASEDLASRAGGVPTVAWISLGAGGVLGAAGYLAYRRADSLATESAGVCARSIQCDPARVDAVRRWDATALGLWIGAAAAIGTGVTVVIMNRPSHGADAALVVAPDSVSLRGSFP